MRRCELATLTVEDVQFTAYRMQLIIRRSKTDQQGQGHSIHLDARSDRVCPVRALRTWLESANLNTGPVFLSFLKGIGLAWVRLWIRAISLSCLKPLRKQLSYLTGNRSVGIL